VSVLPRRLAKTDAALLVVMAAVVASVVLAALSSRVGSIDDRARAIEAQLRCPTCQGLSIADSPATSASQMRALVQEQLAAGESDDAVRAFFVARYGRWILLDPPVGGPDLAVWLAPAVIVTFGAVLVVRRARLRVPAGSARASSAPPPLPTSRLPTVLVGAAMVLALVVPIAAAVGPRLAGQEVSGGGVSQVAPEIEELEAFVRAEPGDVVALVALGDALLAANRAGEAADRYKAALEVEPDNTRALLGIGTILLAADRPDAAGPVFDRILKVSPDQPDALLYRAVARLRLEGGASVQVRDDVRRFLAVASPDDPRRAMAAGLLEEGSAPSASPAATASPTP
jgi:cytochrome c-type biogenesis protein CcmH